MKMCIVLTRNVKILLKCPYIVHSLVLTTHLSYLKVPVIGIMGSGGGFRAACGLSGVMMALEESKIFHCSTYLTGLSGSSW